MLRIAVNDLSFYITYASESHEKEAVRCFYEVFSELYNPRYHNVEKIYGNYPKNITNFLHKGKIENTLSRYEIVILLSLLNKLCYIQDEKDWVKVEEIDSLSVVCGWAKTGIVISITFSDYFSYNTFAGTDSEGNDISIRNIATQEHIADYSYDLGRRKYVGNDKHRLKKYQRSSGYEVSPMNISDEKAQLFLDRAVKIDDKSKRLYYYDKDNDQYYVFPCTRKNIYHGFQPTNLSQDVRFKIRKLCG